MKTFRFLALLACLTFAAMPVTAQPVPALPSEVQGDVVFLEGSDLETALGNAIAEATDQLGSGESAGNVIRSPALLTILYGLLGSVVTFFGTNGFKLSGNWLRGRKTQLMAAALSVLTAGAGGYFGLSEAAGVTGIEGALLAALAALGSYVVAVGAHERNRYQETGLRKPERKAGAMVADTVLEGLVLAAKVLLLPFNLGEPLIRSMYQTHGAKVVKDMIDQQRALSLAEIEADQDRWKAENPMSEEELEAAKKRLKLRQPRVAEVPDRDPLTEGSQ